MLFCRSTRGVSAVLLLPFVLLGTACGELPPAELTDAVEDVERAVSPEDDPDSEATRPATAAANAAERNWHQWRGPLATGEVPHGNPPTTWSEDDPTWKVAIPGRGSSTPIVWEDRIFLQTAIPTGERAETGEPPADAEEDRGRGRGRFGRGGAPDEVHRFVVLCLDRRTGETLWERAVREEVPHEGHHQDHGYASFSPTTDGEYLIAYFGSRGLHGLDLAGNILWSRDLGRQQTRNSFGEGSSPVLHGDVVVVNWDHEGEDDFIAAFDKRTGEELWRQARSEPTTWATPLVVEHQGQPQVVTAGTEQCRAYDLRNGELLWQAPGLTTNAIPSPVAADGMVYLTSGFRGSALLAIELGHTGDLEGGEAIRWTHDRNTPYVPSPLLYRDRLYFFSSNNAILTCFDVRSGEPLFGPSRLEGMSGVYASPVAAAGRVYLVGRNGVSLVLRASDELEVLATNTLDDRIDASPAVVGNQIFLRGHTYLYCFGEE